MLIIDRTQRIWAALSLVICAIASGVYVVYATNAINGPSGGSLPGLIFGIIAAIMMIFAGLLAARRRFPAARLGSAQFWLRGHLWIGALTVPFALFHAGFGWGGRLEWLLWALFFAVIGSGFWGLALQQLLPRMMLEQIPRETFIEQIPHLCLKFTSESDRLLADACGPLNVSVTPVELKLFQPHLWPHFEEDRKKNRNDYPKPLSEADQFQIFLAKVYSSVTPPAISTAPAAGGKPVGSAVPPTVTSVARVTGPESQPAGIPPSARNPDAPAIKSRPDPQALLAAAKARKEQAAAASDSAVPPSGTGVSSPPDAAQPPAEKAAKPDPQALLAAARARKAAAAGDSPPGTAEATAIAADGTAPAASTKPDPRAMLAAAKARKEALAGETTSPPVNPTETSASNPAPIESAAPSAPVTGKPDPRAMLAAMKAKKEAASAGEAASSTAATAVQPLAPLQPVKEPVAESRPSAPAARIAPPSTAQITELKQFYLGLIRPQLPLQRDTHAWMDAIRRSTLACRIRQDSVHPQFVEIYNRLHDVCEQRRQFAFVQRYHRWLHGWLLVHIPATVALYAILIAHAVVALRVIPFGN